MTVALSQVDLPSLQIPRRKQWCRIASVQSRRCHGCRRFRPPYLHAPSDAIFIRSVFPTIPRTNASLCSSVTPTANIHHQERSATPCTDPTYLAPRLTS